MPRMPEVPWREVAGGWALMGLAAGLMGLLAHALGTRLGVFAFHGPLGTSLRLFPLILVCALAYGSLLLLLRVPEARQVLALVRRRLIRRP